MNLSSIFKIERPSTGESLIKSLDKMVNKRRSKKFRFLRYFSPTIILYFVKWVIFWILVFMLASYRNTMVEYVRAIERTFNNILISDTKTITESYQYKDYILDFWNTYNRINNQSLIKFIYPGVYNSNLEGMVVCTDTISDIAGLTGCKQLKYNWEVEEYINLAVELIKKIKRTEIEVFYVSINYNRFKSEFNQICYMHKINILLEGPYNIGLIRVKSKISEDTIDCKAFHIVEPKKNKLKEPLIIVATLIAVISAIGLITSLKSFINMLILMIRISLYIEKFGKSMELITSEKLAFLETWNTLYISSNIMSLISSTWLMSVIISPSLHGMEVICILIGICFILVSICNVRILQKFPEFNMLIHSINNASRPMLRFLVCVLIIFFGFCTTGFAIFSPYHPRFDTFQRSASTLFALLIGDDLYATFYETDRSDIYIWIFSKLFFWIYIFLFMTMVASTFVSILTTEFQNHKFYGIVTKTKITLYQKVTNIIKVINEQV